MANTVYMSKTGLTGGQATKLDSIDGAGLVDNDAAFVNVSNVQYIYRLDADSGAAESSPNIIAPDTNAGNKRWILQGVPVATGISGLGANMAAWLADPTSAKLAATVTNETGSGALVFATSPTLVTPTIGAAAGTSLSLSGLTASLPVFTDGSKNLVSKSVADTLTALGIGAWTDYSATSTVTGWSSTTVKKIYYTVVNNIVFVYFDIVGTSNQTYARFTVPYNAANTIDIQRFCYAYSLNNGDPLPTNGAVNIGTISKSTAIVDCLFGQGTWTNSGDKIVCGQFYYAK
jgi:hypothetical protein